MATITNKTHAAATTGLLSSRSQRDIWMSGRSTSHCTDLECTCCAVHACIHQSDLSPCLLHLQVCNELSRWQGLAMETQQEKELLVAERTLTIMHVQV